MQTFHRNLCVREQILSAIWLHDGMWLDQEVSDESIRSAEREFFQGFSPPLPSEDSVPCPYV